MDSGVLLGKNVYPSAASVRESSEARRVSQRAAKFKLYRLNSAVMREVRLAGSVCKYLLLVVGSKYILLHE